MQSRSGGTTLRPGVPAPRPDSTDLLAGCGHNANGQSMQDAIRHEIAVTAARLVAEGGLDYRSARLKAAKHVLGDRSIPRGVIPDDEELEAALREHLELFDPDHEGRLDRRRRVALEWMRLLEAYRPFVSGAAWRGIAAEHAPVHLQLFHDNPKDVEIDLLNRGVRFEVAVVPGLHDRNTEVESLSFVWRGEPILISLHDSRELRGALKRDDRGRAERGDRLALEALMAEVDPDWANRTVALGVSPRHRAGKTARLGGGDDE